MAMTRDDVVMRWLAGVVLVALGATTAIFQTDPGTDMLLGMRLPVNSDGPEMMRTSLPPVARPRQ